jgi:hypothetical protein
MDLSFLLCDVMVTHLFTTSLFFHLFSCHDQNILKCVMLLPNVTLIMSSLRSPVTSDKALSLFNNLEHYILLIRFFLPKLESLKNKDDKYFLKHDKLYRENIRILTHGATKVSAIGIFRLCSLSFASPFS